MEKRGLVYNVDAHYSLSVRPYTWDVFATTRKRNLQRLLKETKAVLQGLVENPPIHSIPLSFSGVASPIISFMMFL
ncbi:MAG: hypothetical protein ACUVWJ_03890 [Spirochaetota bacterium]